MTDRAKPIPRPAPLSMRAPIARILAWPLDSGSSVATGGISQCAFKAAGIPAASIDAPLTLTVTTGPVAWHADGGLVFPTGGAGNCYAEFNPGAGAARTFMENMLNLETFNQDERLICAAEIITPAGWGAAKTTGACVVSIGNLNQTAGNRGYAFELTSAELPFVVFSALGRTSGSPSGMSPANMPLVPDNARSVVIWEMLCREDGGRLWQLRSHCQPDGGALASSSWTADIDLTEPANGGTAPPGLTSTSGIRIGRRNRTATQNQITFGERLRSVSLIRLSEEQQG